MINEVRENLCRETYFISINFLTLTFLLFQTLERNMSLSGQYLEELSRRYKKQVEEMQKTFEKTVQQMSEDRRRSNEREQKYMEQMSTLQEKIEQMSSSMKTILEDKESWFGTMTFLKFIIFQTLTAAAAFYYINKRRKIEPVIVQIPKKKKKQDKFRRKSVEGVSGHATPAAKKRRPSEEALQIARQAVEDAKDDNDGEWQVARKNRRRKTSIVHRALEQETNKVWARQDSIGQLQENVIPLDEAEYYAPVSEPKEFIEPLPPKPDSTKTNGFFNNLKSKTMKTRRLSSPAFLRTLSRQSTRSTPSPVVRKLEPIYNGNKAGSESPTGSLWSESTEISQISPNGTEGGKKKKSLKNILKKVF